MCGITGFWHPFRAPVAGGNEGLIRDMVKAVGHRGPDGSGTWTNGEGLFLGHARLAVIDVSERGHQPMCSSGSVITFNGEIYNYRKIRKLLMEQGTKFRTESDTEVLLEAIKAWGVEQALRRIDGMFAFAYWSSSDKMLILARDRFGEKPLYYAFTRTGIVFASEIKALCLHQDISRDIDLNALSEYFGYMCIGAPRTIYSQIKKMRGGCYCKIADPMEEASQQEYYSTMEVARTAMGARRRPPLDAKESIECLHELLRGAVHSRMVADVPLGAFLSGGIDSSTVVAIMQEKATKPVKTFTIGFWESEFDESNDAAKVAKILRTEHYHLYLGGQDAAAIVERLPEIYDEPFADVSQISTVAVSAFAREHVTVSLSGDGGDEMFSGYNRHRAIYELFVAPYAELKRKALGIANGIFGPMDISRYLKWWDWTMPKKWHVANRAQKWYKLSRSLSGVNVREIYQSMMSERHVTEALLIERGVAESPACYDGAIEGSALEQVMLFDQVGYFSNDILCKLDRATMAVGLEGRVPFVDLELVKFAWTLTDDIRMHGTVGKWPLREVLKKYMPEKLFDRPKAGFDVPIGSWLRGSLRGWADELLSESSLKRSGLINVRAGRELWHRHCSGEKNLQQAVWSLLMFQAWHRKYFR